MCGQPGVEPVVCNHPTLKNLLNNTQVHNLVFVALSIDDNKWAWQNEASEKSLRVLHLHVNDKDLFGQAYGIDYIPRYILLDPDGKIINAQMPEPGNPLFEEILRREIPGLESL